MDTRRALSLASGRVGQEQNKDSKEELAYIILGGREKGLMSNEWAVPGKQYTR